MPDYKPKPCVECEQEFQPQNSNRKWCSLGCKMLSLLQSHSVINPNGCWLWLGPKHNFGYGAIPWGDKNVGVHRAAFLTWRGPIPDGLCVCHTCDNPDCFNPAHLWLGTSRENSADREAKGRGNPPRGHSNGHAKLTDALVLEIIADSGTHQKIADIYGVRRQTIGDIKTGRTWKHLAREQNG